MKNIKCYNCENFIKDVRWRCCSHKCEGIVKKKEFEQKYYENPKMCLYCSNAIKYIGNFSQTLKKKFCDHKCSASYTNKNRKIKEYTKRKISLKLKKKYWPYSSIKFYVCKETGKIYSSRNSDGSVRKCSPYISYRDNIKQYRKLCQFNFSLNSYPNKFNFVLIEKYGWYSFNKNVNGISRDHMFSIAEGFKLGIDPKIISHPANCTLLRHNDNISKHKKCSITLEELQNRINNWD